MGKMTMDQFRRDQKEVLASWSTGSRVNFEEAVEYQKSLPENMIFAKKLKKAKEDKPKQDDSIMQLSLWG